MYSLALPGCPRPTANIQNSQIYAPWGGNVIAFQIKWVVDINPSVTAVDGGFLFTCAATVCERVGNSLVTHAVLKPASDRPKAARSPAPPAPTTTASNSWSTTGYCVDICNKTQQHKSSVLVLVVWRGKRKSSRKQSVAAALLDFNNGGKELTPSETLASLFFP